MAGDRIVRVDDSLFVGPTLTNEKAMRHLKGPKGTEVKLAVKRATEKELLDFLITRGDIPQNTINAAYMVDDDFGYIQISKFGRTTHVELLNALAQLGHQRCKGVIVDLRGNTGGYMEAAIRMVNEFLPKGQLIVYTASASEIFAGAIQDNDRGTIVGLRSFGKGLVQQPIDFSDGSAIRLTIARYYTPSGRCIQRPYQSGKDATYEMDLISRYEHGEYFSKDSVKQDEALRYSTSLGRTVYGGGGIMPDVFVPQDTTGISSYLIEVSNKGLIIQYCFHYTDTNRAKLSSFDNGKDLLKYLQRQGLMEQFIRFAEKKGVKRRNLLINKSRQVLEKSLYGNIIYNMLGQEEFIRYSNESDATVKKAIDILQKGEAFPQIPGPLKLDSHEGEEKRTAQAHCRIENPARRCLYAALG